MYGLFGKMQAQPGRSPGVARPLIAAMPQRFEFTPLGGKGLPDTGA